MSKQTQTAVLQWLASFNGDSEKCARWMRDSLKVGGLRDCRELVAQAVQS